MCKSAAIGVTLLLALSACASMPSPEEQAQVAAITAKLQQPISSPHKLIVDDQRPDTSRKGYNLSGFFFGCENGVWNIGDRQIGDRIPRLETDLLSAFGDAVQGQQLVVRQYAIYLNGRAALEREVTSGTGLLGYALGPGPILRAKCEHSLMTSGWFDTSEIANNYSPIVIEMDVSLNGDEFVVRSVFSPEIEAWHPAFDNNSLSPVLTVSVQEAIAKADAALVAEIKNRRLVKAR